MEERKLFRVEGDGKCGGCNWEIQNVFLLAHSQEEANNLCTEYEYKGLCGDCMVELMLDDLDVTVLADHF